MRTTHSLLNKIAKTDSNKEKEAILREHKNNGFLKEILYYALNPFITYGITKFGKSSLSDKFSTPWFVTRKILKDLSTRVLSGSEADIALRYLVGGFRNIKEENLLRMIIARDLKCGLGAKTVNKVFPGLIPQFNIMLASKDIEPEYPCIVEPKLDGVRCITMIDEEGNITYFSRKGKEFFNFNKFDRELKSLKLKGVVLDGEVVSPEDFQVLMTCVRRKKDLPTDLDINYVIWDIIPLIDFKNQVAQKESILERRSKLFKKIHSRKRNTIKSIHHDIAHSEEEVTDLFNYHLRKGYEGILIKQNSTIVLPAIGKTKQKNLNTYEYKRSRNWIKMKPVNDVDLKIVGFEEGEGRHKGRLGAIIVNHKGKKVNVGSGFSDSERTRIWKNKKKYKGKVVEIAYQEETKDGSLRFPVFKGMRFDK